MNRNIVFAVCLASSLLFFSEAPSAQQSAPPTAQQPAPPSTSKANPTAEQVNDANIQLMREDIRSERKKVVAANMPLTAAEATRFWPLYDQYMSEMIKINDTRYALIKEYSQNYDRMTDPQADSFIKRWTAFDGDFVQLRMKYIPEFEKVISPQKTATFFQIDRRVHMMIELQLADQVPLVKP